MCQVLVVPSETLEPRNESVSGSKPPQLSEHPILTSCLLFVTTSKALVTSSVALVTSSFLLLVAWHLLLVAWHLLLVASCYY